MSKTSVIFICVSCDSQYPKWNGRCSECGKWGTLKEGLDEGQAAKKSLSAPAEELATLASVAGADTTRLQTGIKEFDQVVGGGVVLGSLILLGGEPGIGKSTLALQILQAAALNGLPLYVSGEESGQQIKLRSDRLGIASDKINFLSQTNVEKIASTIIKEKPSLVIIDSIQTIYSSEVDSEPGSLTNVRACTVKLLQAAKESDTPIILIGHVTKDGLVAGPKTLEHLVDTVLYLEGDRFHTFRLLRTVRNRFGPTNEVGVFEMTAKGLEAVANPSLLFVSSQQDLPGSVVTCLVEGRRPFLVEVQALVTKSAYASPQRRASGFDVNRLQLLLAVLQQRAGYDFTSKDVHLNVVGGLRIQDPATDLAICAALISALQDKPVDEKTVVLGEVGLAGEVRAVRQLAERLKEANKLGFKKAIVPDQKNKSLLEIKTVTNLKDLNI